MRTLHRHRYRDRDRDGEKRLLGGQLVILVRATIGYELEGDRGREERLDPLELLVWGLVVLGKKRVEERRSEHLLDRCKNKGMRRAEMVVEMEVDMEVDMEAKSL